MRLRLCDTCLTPVSMFAPNKVTLGCIVMVKLIYVQNLDIVNNATARNTVVKIPMSLLHDYR